MIPVASEMNKTAHSLTISLDAKSKTSAHLCLLAGTSLLLTRSHMVFKAAKNIIRHKLKSICVRIEDHIGASDSSQSRVISEGNLNVQK